MGDFCGPRASKVMGRQWKSWTGEALMPYGTAFICSRSGGAYNILARRHFLEREHLPGPAGTFQSSVPSGCI
jgi:hypothetical protein